MKTPKLLALGSFVALLVMGALFQSQGMPIGGGPVSLTSTQIAYGSGTNGITSEAALSYDAANNRLTAGAVRTDNGTAAQAAYGFTNQVNSGMRLVAAGLVAVQVAGTDSMYFSATALVPNLPQEGPTGSAANTTYGYASDTNTGTYRIGADHLGFAAGGLKASLSTTELRTEAGVYLGTGHNVAGAPAAGDCDNDAEIGRTSVDTTNERFYVCNGATRGWDYVALTD